ncbi:acetylcholinesterase precursor [Sporormia fimetaria CBS 119925]|uniref:Carboxylic ester hydrolase n=1 Tax=Sporormia fimetaria CBS 119925 TaxID=1340428 RepID=A0A6A6UYZ4_9PLEO|nr:acetylcholinesterase precursor [Sporormia fimetaria CBS 119925]
MAILGTFLAVTSGLVGLSAASPLETRASIGLSNAKSSLTLIYQNNLNVTDDKNHIGAIVLDPLPQSEAAAACSALNEKLISKSTVQKYANDFNDALSYQNYAKYSDAEQGYHIQDGILSVGNRVRYLDSKQGGRKSLPVLCTQSANNGNSGAAPASGSEVSVAAAGNTYVGFRNQKSFRFLGIRFADTPKRFKYPTLFSGKGLTVQATAFGSTCVAYGSGSEDCLFMNIQTPYIPKANSKKNLRPVLFWIHGGGFTGGSGSDLGSDGGNLASKEDMVVVTFNYRLSNLGFLAIPGTDLKGNYGIADQVAALDWVIANIAAFGGDPKRITINGGSAGAGSVRALMGSPKAVGKFQGAMLHSNLGGGKTLGQDGDYGTTYSLYKTIEESYNTAGPQILEGFGCNSTDMAANIACLEKVPALDLNGFSTVARYVVQDGTYVNTPNLDVTSRDSKIAHVPVIFGITRDDGASFTNYPKTPVSSHLEGLQVGLGINSTWAQRVIDSRLFPLVSTGNLTLDSYNVSSRITTDKMYRCIDQATVYAGVSTRAFPRAYYYQLERTFGGYDPNNIGGPAGDNPNSPYFRLHGGDIAWVFGNIPYLRNADDLWSMQLSTSYFGAFVRNGDPNPDLRYLDQRGYGKVVEGVRKNGRWEAVDEKARGGDEVRLLDWPSRSVGFVDVQQCEWLGYPLKYYLEGGF